MSLCAGENAAKRWFTRSSHRPRALRTIIQSWLRGKGGGKINLLDHITLKAFGQPNTNRCNRNILLIISVCIPHHRYTKRPNKQVIFYYICLYISIQTNIIKITCLLGLFVYLWYQIRTDLLEISGLLGLFLCICDTEYRNNLLIRSFHCICITE